MSEDKQEAPKKTKTMKQCPQCSATKFRQHAKGEIVNGKMKVDSHDFQCLGCHKVYNGIEKLLDVKG